MTDQERARQLYNMSRNAVAADGEPKRVIQYIAAILKAERDAAASEARADARVRIAQRVSERCILRLQVGRDPVEEANEIIQHLAHDIETDWADYDDDDDEAALATPAQSET